MSDLITYDPVTNSSIFYGYFENYVFRDEKSGQSAFFFRTKQKLYSELQYRKKEVIRNRVTKTDEEWFTIYCDAFDVFSVSYEKHTPICVTGRFQNLHETQYGWSFKASQVKECAVDEVTTIEYLASEAFPGISYEIAVKIVKYHGADIFSFVKNNPNATSILVKETGLSVDDVELMIGTINRTMVERELFDFLSPLDVPYSLCAKAVRLFGKNVLAKFKDNPYTCGAKIGLDFLHCDRIGKSLSFPATDKKRLEGACYYTMGQITEQGHTYIEEKDFLDFYSRLVVNEYYNEYLNNFFLLPFIDKGMSKKEINGKKVFCNKRIVMAEKKAAKNLLRLCHSGNKNEPFYEGLIEEASNFCHMKFGTQQRQAFSMALSQKGVKILNGGPGTGKTTTVKGILYAYSRMHPNDKICLCAPTGRAAQRLAESTEMPATTIHRLLDYRPYGDDVSHKDENSPIDADFIVVDEMSMTDIELFDLLLAAIKNNTTLLMVGDFCQLESVGPGAVLLDLLDTPDTLIQKCFLTEVFRQKGGSPIIDNSNRINKGDVNLDFNHPDFQLIKTKNEEETMERVKELMKELYNPSDPFETQILCPSKKGVSGVDNCNLVLQSILNPGKKGLKYGHIQYRVNDKIIMKKNNYDESCLYYNGDIGIIKEISNGKMKVSIRDETLDLTKDKLEEMSLSYSMTIHKSQGSEFKNVIVVMPMNPSGMLVRNLLYTAVTRAKKKVYIINESSAMETSIKVNKTGRRNTTLLDAISARV